MAEGFAKSLKSDVIEAHSAGVAPKGLDPKAVKVMAPSWHRYFQSQIQAFG